MDWRKNLNWREVLSLLVGAIALGFAYQGIDKYIYRPCRIPLSVETVFGRRAPFYVLAGFLVVLYLALVRISWFAGREGYAFFLALGLCAGIAFVGVVLWCQ